MSELKSFRSWAALFQALLKTNRLAEKTLYVPGTDTGIYRTMYMKHKRILYVASQDREGNE